MLVISRYSCTALLAGTRGSTDTGLHWVRDVSWDSVGEEVSEIGSHLFCGQLIWSYIIIWNCVQGLESNDWYYCWSSSIIKIVDWAPESLVFWTFPTWKHSTYVICIRTVTCDPVISEVWIAFALRLTFCQVSNLNSCNPVLSSCCGLHFLYYLIRSILIKSNLNIRV